MVDVTERMKGVEPSDLLDKCQLFLGAKWSNVTLDTFDFTVLTLGFGNRLFSCQIKDQPSTRVLIRLLGGNVLPQDAPIRKLTEITETLVFYIVGKNGLGPQLLGSFDGGRVEEFVTGERLTLEEWMNPEVNDAVAAKLAMYHQLQVPISRKPWDFVDMMRTCVAKFRQTHPELSKDSNLGKYEPFRSCIEMDVESEISWLQKVASSLQTRIVLTHNDINRSNIMIKPKTSSNSWLDRVVILDYEFSSYSHRGQDIGNSFCMKVFDFGAEKFISGHNYPDEKFRRRFISSYLKEMKSSGMFEDWDDNGLDSVDHVLLEAEFGAIYCRLINVFWCLRDIDMWLNIMNKRKGDPDFKEDGMSAFPNFVKERKLEFEKKWPQFFKN